MWIIFEGLDKTGKTTLEWELLKATNFKHIVIDRGPAGYATFDKILNRETPSGVSNFIKQAREIMELDSMVVYCKANEQVVNQRLKDHNEKQLDSGWPYENMQELYERNVHLFYDSRNVLVLDTSDKTIPQCIKIIKNRIEEVKR